MDARQARLQVPERLALRHTADHLAITADHTLPPGALVSHRDELLAVPESLNSREVAATGSMTPLGTMRTRTDTPSGLMVCRTSTAGDEIVWYAVGWCAIQTRRGGRRPGERRSPTMAGRPLAVVYQDADSPRRTRSLACAVARRCWTFMAGGAELHRNEPPPVRRIGPKARGRRTAIRRDRQCPGFVKGAPEYPSGNLTPLLVCV